jgi:hypothetical protein
MVMLTMEKKFPLGRPNKTYLCFQDDELLSTLDAVRRCPSIRL